MQHDHSWRSCILGDVINLQRGFDLPERERQLGEIPIVSSSGVTGYHSIAKVKGPGVVTGRYGTLGQVFYIKERFWPLNTTLFVQDFKGNNPLFISYFLKTLNLAHQNSAGAVPGVNRNALHLMPVYIPPLSIQRTIANILSTYDDLIENNTRRITILEQMAQMLYQEWFVKFRFPGHEQMEMVESEVGIIPKGWKFVHLDDIAGVNLHTLKSGFELEEIHYIDISSVSTGIIQKVELMPFNLAPGRARRIVKHGDIIWSTVRPNRKSYSIILNPPDNLIVSTGFAVITSKTVPYTYLYLALTTDDFADYLANHATGSAYPAVNSKEFQVASILQPPEKLLDLFHNITLSIFQRQHILHKQNIILRQKRDMLLPKLISGEMDVSAWVGEGVEEVAEELGQEYEVKEPMVRRVAEAGVITPIEKDGLEQPSLWG